MDEKLALEIRDMYRNNKVGEKPENLLKIYELVKQLSAENEELQEELEDINEFQGQIHITEPEFKCWVKFGDEKFDYGEGDVEDPSFVLSCSQEIMGGMMQGDIDKTSAYMAGDLKIDGNLQDSMAYGEFLGLAMELFRDLE